MKKWRSGHLVNLLTRNYLSAGALCRADFPRREFPVTPFGAGQGLNESFG
jgi:hypothetical protein